MRKNLKNFLTLSLALFFVGCTTNPKPAKFDGDWEFYSATPFEEPKACLSKADVKKLREILIRCDSGGK